MQKSVNKKPIANQMMIKFPEPERLENNSLPITTSDILSPPSLFETAISLLEVEDKMFQAVNVFFSLTERGKPNDDRDRILTHFWVLLRNIREELGMANRLLSEFIEDPEIEFNEFYGICTEAEAKLKEVLL